VIRQLPIVASAALSRLPAPVPGSSRRSLSFASPAPMASDPKDALNLRLAPSPLRRLQPCRFIRGADKALSWCGDRSSATSARARSWPWAMPPGHGVETVFPPAALTWIWPWAGAYPKVRGGGGLGPESSGKKTTLTRHMPSPRPRRRAGVAAFVDAEHCPILSMPLPWRRREKFCLVSQPERANGAGGL